MTTSTVHQAQSETIARAAVRPAHETERTEALAERLVGATTAALELFSVHLGREGRVVGSELDGAVRGRLSVADLAREHHHDPDGGESEPQRGGVTAHVGGSPGRRSGGGNEAEKSRSRLAPAVGRARGGRAQRG